MIESGEIARHAAPRPGIRSTQRHLQSVCVYCCSTCYKAVRVGVGPVEEPGTLTQGAPVSLVPQMMMIFYLFLQKQQIAYRYIKKNLFRNGGMNLL